MSARSVRRVLDDRDPAVLFRPVLEAGGQVPLTVTGRSMEPYLQEQRDTVYLTAVTRPLRRGDIVFFRRPSGGWVLHRVLRLASDGASEGCVVGGDAQMWTEPVRAEWILAVVTAVERDGHIRSTDGFRDRLWVFVWRALRPLRPWLLAAWRRIHRNRHAVTERQ